MHHLIMLGLENYYSSSNLHFDLRLACHPKEWHITNQQEHCKHLVTLVCWAMAEANNFAYRQQMDN